MSSSFPATRFPALPLGQAKGAGEPIYKDAIAAGGKSLSEPKDQFYGERSGGVVDAWGNHWYIATHTEDLTTEELMSRVASQGKPA